MEPLLLFPDPPPPELAQALDLSGYPWKAVGDEVAATRSEPDDGWAGAIVCADVDPEGAFSICRAPFASNSGLPTGKKVSRKISCAARSGGILRA